MQAIMTIAASRTTLLPVGSCTETVQKRPLFKSRKTLPHRNEIVYWAMSICVCIWYDNNKCIFISLISSLTGQIRWKNYFHLISYRFLLLTHRSDVYVMSMSTHVYRYSGHVCNRFHAFFVLLFISHTFQMSSIEWFGSMLPISRLRLRFL